LKSPHIGKKLYRRGLDKDNLGRGSMKRIVILIDATWDKEGTTGNTNVAKLDLNRLIKRQAAQMGARMAMEQPPYSV
jgi:uncharacterized protein (DUF2235 family)